MSSTEAVVITEDVPSVEATRLLRHVRRTGLGLVFNRLARAVVVRFARRSGGLNLMLSESGEAISLRCENGAPDAEAHRATIFLHDVRTYGAITRHGTRGLGSAYVAGWWDADDLTAAMQELYLRTEQHRSRMDKIANLPLYRRSRDLLSQLGKPGRRADRRNIRAHYDLSNEFFELVLDETMTYSCAMFPDLSLSLREAQHLRIEHMCRKLELNDEDHLLEIGSGWGEFAVYAATNFGCKVTTTTISLEQQRYVEEKVAHQGLEDRVTVLGSDWRDLEGEYDKLVSVEMIEAVDWRNHREFFEKCGALIRRGGLACIQAIVIDDRSYERAKRRSDFIKSMIFPGSCIPSISSLSRAIGKSGGLLISGLEEIGQHYGETLRRWQQRLATNTAALEEIGAPLELRRLFHLYLSYCEAGFLERHISDVQVLLWRPEGAR